MELHASGRAALAVMAAVVHLGCDDDAPDAPGPSQGAYGNAGSGDGSGGEGGEPLGGTTGSGGAGGSPPEECLAPFDPDGDGRDDGARRERPSDPEIVVACEAYCEAVGDVCAGELAHRTCVDHCRLRACEACRGTWVPVVDCERVETDPDECTCANGVPACPIAPGRCSDYLDATRQCAT